MSGSVDVELNLDACWRALDTSMDTNLRILSLRTKAPSSAERNAVLETVLNGAILARLDALTALDRVRLVTMAAKKQVLEETGGLDAVAEVTDENVEEMIRKVVKPSNDDAQGAQDLWARVEEAKVQFSARESADLLKHQNGIQYQAKPVSDVVKYIKARLFVKAHPTFQLPSELDPNTEFDGDGDVQVETGGLVSLNCPISQTLMTVPVRNGACVHVYEEKNIVAYKAGGNSTCPECGAQLGHFKPDHIMALRIAAKKAQDSWGWRSERSASEVIDTL